MIFKVGTTVSAPDTSSLPMQMKPIAGWIPSDASHDRQIVFGQMNMPNGLADADVERKSWDDPITEKPVLGTTEVWELINTVPDMHPFHIHWWSFRFWIARRMMSMRTSRPARSILHGFGEPPDPNEMGGKTSFVCHPRIKSPGSSCSFRALSRLLRLSLPYPRA